MCPTKQWCFGLQDGDGEITLEEFVPVVEMLLFRKTEARKHPKGRSAKGQWMTAANKMRALGVFQFGDAQVVPSSGSAKASTFDVIRLRRAALRATAMKQHNQSAVLMCKAVVLAAKLNENSSLHIACLLRQAHLLRERALYHEARGLYQALTVRLNRLKATAGLSPPQAQKTLAECYEQLAVIHRCLGEFNQAESMSLLAVEAVGVLYRHESAQLRDAHLLRLLTAYHEMLVALQRHPLAVSVLEQIRGIRQSEFERQHKVCPCARRTFTLISRNNVSNNQG